MPASNAAISLEKRLLGSQGVARVCAHLIGDRLDLRGVDSEGRIAVAPLVLPAGERGCVVLFKWGAAVTFSVAPAEEAGIFATLSRYVQDPVGKAETEEAEIRLSPTEDETIDNGVIYLQDASVERVQLVAEAMAKSVALAHQESLIQTAFERVEPLAEALRRAGRARWRGKELLRHLGSTLAVEHQMVGRVEVDDKPEILWDRPELERLYARLVDEYELRERHAALERKLGLITRTAGTVLELLQNRRSLRVEWYIVALILFEILLTLYTMFLQS